MRKDNIFEGFFMSYRSNEMDLALDYENDKRWIKILASLGQQHGEPPAGQSSKDAEAAIQHYVEERGPEALRDDQSDGIQTERGHGGEAAEDPDEEEDLDVRRKFRDETGEEYYRYQRASDEVHDKRPPREVVSADVILDEVSGDAADGTAETDEGNDLDLLGNHEW